MTTESMDEIIQRLMHEHEDIIRKKNTILSLQHQKEVEANNVRKLAKKLKGKASPSQREKRWVSIAVKDVTYAKIKELANYNNIAVGEVIMRVIDETFEKALQESKS
jgi:hypothetical protein